MTYLVTSLKSIPLRVLSFLLVSCLMERQIMVHSKDRSLLFALFNSIDMLLTPLKYRHLKISWVTDKQANNLLDCPTPYFIGTSSASVLASRSVTWVTLDCPGSAIGGKKNASDDHLSFTLNRLNWVELNSMFKEDAARSDKLNQAKVFQLVVSSFIKSKIGNREYRRWKLPDGSWGVDQRALGGVTETQAFVCYYSEMDVSNTDNCNDRK